MSTNQLYQMSEIVRKEMMPEWSAKDYGVLTDFVEKGEVEMVGERDYRIPVQITPGGRVGHYDPQGGDQGRGTSPTGNTLTQSFYSFRLNFEFNSLQIMATQNKKLAVKNPFTDSIARGMKEMEYLWDKQIHGDGSAKLATSVGYSTSSGVSVYTMDTNFGTQLLRRGQYYNIYDSTAATLKSASSLWVKDMNTQARTVTLSGIVPSGASGDLFYLEGTSGANPSGPRGLKYWINSATSGTTAGINRALESQLISKSVDGTNGLTVETVMALHDRIMNDRAQVSTDIVGITALAQRAYAYSQMTALQMSLIEGEKANVFDRLPKLKGKKFFMWGDVPHWLDIHQDQTTVAYMIPKLFGRARLGTPGFYETPGKSGADARFIQVYGGSGGPANIVFFGFIKNEDLYCIDPGACGLIGSLPLGSLYQ